MRSSRALAVLRVRGRLPDIRRSGIWGPACTMSLEMVHIGRETVRVTLDDGRPWVGRQCGSLV